MAEETGGSFVSKLFTSGGILAVGLGIQLVFNFFSKLVIARFFGKVSYGSISLGIVMLTTVSIVLLIGTNTGVGRYLPRHDTSEHRRGILVSAFQVVVPLSALVGVVIAIFADPIASYVFTDPSITPVIRIFALAVPLASFMKLTVGSVRGMQQALPRVYIENVSLPLLRFGLIAAAVVTGLGATGVAWAYLASYIAVAGLSLYYLYRHTALFDRTIEVVPMRRELLAFSAPLMITATMNKILGNLDTIILGYFHQTGDVGVYQVVYPLAALLPVVLRAFGFIFMPMVSELHSEGDSSELQRAYQIVTKWVFLLTLPLFLVMAFFPALVVRNSFGPEYVSGAFVLTVLAVGFFTQAITGPAGDALIASGRSRLIMHIHAVTAVLNTLLNVALIPEYSLLGAAVATTASYVFMNALYLVQLYRIVGTHPFAEPLLRPGVATFTVWLPFYWGLERLFSVTVLVLVPAMMVFLLLYIVLILWFGGVEREELVLLRQFEDRSGIDLGPVRTVARRFVR